MHNLVPSYTFGQQPLQQSLHGVTLREQTDLALISVALRQQAAAIQKSVFPLGLSWPQAGQATSQADQCLMWLGQQHYLYELPYTQAEEAMAVLKQFLQDGVSLTQQSDAWAVFDLEGAACLALFERLVMVDVAMMQAGTFVSTSLNHSRILLRCITHGEAFRLYVTRSYARAVYHVLSTTLPGL